VQHFLSAHIFWRRLVSIASLTAVLTDPFFILVPASFLKTAAPSKVCAHVAEPSTTPKRLDSALDFRQMGSWECDKVHQ